MTSGFPSEIVSLFQRPDSIRRSFVFRGAPSTGKTSFIVNLAEALGHSLVIGWNYIDVITDERILLKRFPKLRRDFGLARLQRLEDLSPLRKVPDQALKSLEDSVRAGYLGHPLLRDLIKGHDSRDFDNVANQGHDGPDRAPEVGDWFSQPRSGAKTSDRPDPGDQEPVLPELWTLYRYAERCPTIASLVVIDPLDALAKRYGIGPDRIIETLKRDLIGSDLADIVFVLETASPSRLERFVDAVFSFVPSPLRSPWTGVITIEIMKGRPVRQRQYAFEISEGMFRTALTDDEVVQQLLEEGRSDRHVDGFNGMVPS